MSDDFLFFLKALDHPPEPSPRLVEAAASWRRSSLNSTDPVRAVLAAMWEFVQSKPPRQQTRTKSAREMVEYFACELDNALAHTVRR